MPTTKFQELVKTLARHAPGVTRDVLAKMSKKEHMDLAELYAKNARKAREQYRDALDAAIKKHGDRAPGESVISGVYRESFPEKVKDELRTILRAVSKFSDLAQAHYGATGKRTPWHKTKLASVARPDWSFY